MGLFGDSRINNKEEQAEIDLTIEQQKQAIAEGVRAYLDGQSFARWEERPGVWLPTAVGGAVEKWLDSHKDEIIKAIANRVG